MVMFGGIGGSGQSGNDLWALSLAGAPAWSTLAPGGGPPSDRQDHVAIYDPIRDRMVIYGGQWIPDYYDSSPFRPLGDVWALSLSGTPTWTQLAPTGTPPDMWFSTCAIYDPVRDRMVMFGGSNSAGYHDSVVNDVWALSLSGSPAWTQLTPDGTPPIARMGQAGIYDPIRDRMIVFGGDDDNGTILSDTWALSLTGSPTWTKLTPADTPQGPRAYHTAVYDPVQDRMVVFGGWNGSVLLNDVWALSLSGTPEWTQVAPAGPPPDARAAHSAIYDPVSSRMIVFGGYVGYAGIGDTGFTNDVWTCSLAGSPVWTEIIPAGTSATARHAHTAIYDPVRDHMVVFAGFGDGFFVQASSASLNDTWSLDLAADSGQPTATLASLVSADATAEGIRLVWYVTGGGGSGVTLYRREAATDWMAIGPLTADGTGFLRYEDDSVTPGARYGYRLGISEGGTESYFGETWLQVPASAVLALDGMRPNPAVRELAVSFSLPDDSPASLELMDLAGRRVRSIDVGAQGPGHHVISLGNAGTLPAGIYLIRLHHAQRTLVAKAVVMR
jgi:hypothetical protein